MRISVIAERPSCFLPRRWISKPKTPSAIRTIKLTKITMKVLKRYKQGACGEWMFPSPKDPNRPIDPEACGRRLNRILENAGCRHIRFHDIRHTFATMALENRRKNACGHSRTQYSGNSTGYIYTHNKRNAKPIRNHDRQKNRRNKIYGRKNRIADRSRF